MRAKVIGWTDGGAARRFQDEHGNHWHCFTDAADGTIAVNRVSGDTGEEPNGCGAGVFVWWPDAEDHGTIDVAEEGAFYGVNCTEEYIVRGGEWRDNDGPEGGAL